MGASTALKDGLLLALGGGESNLRDLVHESTKNWNLAVEDIVVKMGETSRKLSPIEHGHVAMVRRIARLRLGLTAIDEQAAIPTTGIGLGFGGPAAVQAPAAAPTAEPRLKLSVIID